MADETGGKISGSDSYSEFPCSTCAKNNVQVEAAWRCIDCRANLCDQCLIQHNKFDLTNGHVVLTKKQAEDSSHTLETVIRKTCRTHTNQVVALYCGNHDVLCCGSCSASHRACQKLQPLPEAANDILDPKKELEKVRLKVDLVTNQLEHLKQNRSDSIAKLAKDKSEISIQFKNFRRKVDEELNRLEERANEEVEDKFNQLSEHMQNDIERLGKLIRSLDESATYIGELTGDNVLEGFVYMKDAEAQIADSKVFPDIKYKRTQQREKAFCSLLNPATVITSELEALEGTEKLEFVIATDVEDCISNLETIGSVTDFFSLSVTSIARPNVKTKGDENCVIYDCCLLEDGSVVLTDVANKKLKVLDTAYSLVNQLKLPSRPCGVCAVSQREVAVAMLDEELIQFVEIGDTLTARLRIIVGKSCRGVACSGARMYVSCAGDSAFVGPGQVRVYSLTGQLLQTFEKDRDGKDIFSMPLNLNVSTSGNQIAVANRTLGMVVLDAYGDVVWSFSNPDLKHVIGVCHVDAATVLVSGYKSGNLFQLGPDGKIYSVLLSNPDGLESFYSLCYDNNNKRLIVSGEGSELVVYQVYRGEHLIFPSGSAV